MLQSFDLQQWYSLADEMNSGVLAGRLEEFLGIPEVCR